MPRFPSAPTRKVSRVAHVAMLALLLLWAQMWGQWHGVAHPQGFALGVAAAHVHAHEGHAAGAEHAGFDHDAGDAECRLLDQLSHADSLPCVPLLALPAGFSTALLAHNAGLAVARWAALFQARAPPTFR